MQEFLKEYLSSLKVEKNLSDNSINSYKTDLSKLFDFFINASITDLNNVNYNHITTFFEQQRSLGIGSRTVSRYSSTFKGFFAFLLDQGYIEKNPVINLKSVTIPRDLPDVLSFEEIDNILEQPNLNNNLGLRDKAILEIMYSSGLRVSELLNLKMYDLLA